MSQIKPRAVEDRARAAIARDVAALRVDRDHAERRRQLGCARYEEACADFNALSSSRPTASTRAVLNQIDAATTMALAAKDEIARIDNDLVYLLQDEEVGRRVADYERVEALLRERSVA